MKIFESVLYQNHHILNPDENSYYTLVSTLKPFTILILVSSKISRMGTVLFTIFNRIFNEILSRLSHVPGLGG